MHGCLLLQALEAVPAGKDPSGKLVQVLYNRLAGASIHPQVCMRNVTTGQ